MDFQGTRAGACKWLVAIAQGVPCAVKCSSSSSA